jgi:hypothetical protein
MVCLVQFHDVLPGSAIEMVYDDVLRVGHPNLVYPLVTEPEHLMNPLHLPQQMHTEVDTLGTVMRDELLDTVLQLDPNISEGKKGLSIWLGT